MGEKEERAWDLSLEETTELTPEACHIPSQASLSNAGPRTKKGASAVTCSWRARPGLMIRKGVGLGQTELI